MPYTVVDKNLLIPEIIVKQEFFEGLEELIKKTYKRDKNYNENIYMVKYLGVRFDGIIKFDGDKFLEINGNESREIHIDYSYLFVNYYQNTKRQEVRQELTNNYNTVNNDNIINIRNVKVDFKDYDDNEENTDMIIKIKDKNDSNILICDSDKLLIKNDEEEKENKEKEEKKNELLKMCEQVMDMYNLEMNKLKKMELNLLTIDDKINKLVKKKREKNFENITRTKNEYETWKKIKYNIPMENLTMLKLSESELELRVNPTIPILFMAKYNYIEKILENDQVREMFNTLNLLDLTKLYIEDEIDLDSKIIKFAEKYTEISKKDLHYKFDHDWDYLDNEYEDVETNHFASKKIIDE